ncbi:arylsulfatase A-like enzyme [Dyadobacter jejuensis]|uniref:Arylsulfatase A-like enzyme n=2 Tax=Dyadobacter jejuensis TaxID=1082580 RepID=A0A316AJN1_9BACT|nr:arylsulfatase A-like enzyme [Dyadobacter jejuensis]
MIHVRQILSPILFLVCVLSAWRSAAQTKPNVLVIYTDDHRFTGIRALGYQDVDTPNIDALVNNGVAYSQTYLMGAFHGATCMPSRAMLMTGRNLFELGNLGHSIPTTHTTMGEAFRDQGYYSYIIGKWHQDQESLRRTFNAGTKIMGLGLYLTDHYRMPLWDYQSAKGLDKSNAYLLKYVKGDTVRVPFDPKLKRGPFGTENTGPHTSELFANEAVKFFENYKKKDPFFMYLAFQAPHDPRQAPQKYRDRYPVDKMKLMPSYSSEHPFDNGDMFLRDEELAPWPRTPEVARQELADYYAIITHLDAQIGKVVAALKANGQYENTLIVLAGDSGLAVGNHGLLGKQNIYDEDGIHVPFIVSGALVKDKGRRVDSFGYIHDIFPTVCDYAGIPIPSSVTGKSLWPAAGEGVTPVRGYTYHAYKQFQRAYRKGDYKLIEYVKAPEIDPKTKEVSLKGSRVTQLFNIKKDPWETLNLSIFPEHFERLHEMQAGLKQAAIENHDDNKLIGYPYNFWDFYELTKPCE